MKLFFIIVALLLILATALPLSRSKVWWVRGCDFPRIQIAFLLALSVATYPLFGKPPGMLENVMFLALGLCLIYQIYMISPYTIITPKQVLPSMAPQKSSSVSLLFANVRMNNHDDHALKRIIRENDPDIILAVEPDDWWQKAFQELGKTHPFTIQHPQDNTYGMLLYSRLPLVDPEIRFLVERDIPSVRTKVELRSGTQIELYGLHPKPPFPSHEETSGQRDSELLVAGKEIAQKKLPRIVLGDLNDVAWSRTNYRFQAISGLLDPRVGRGFYSTFHAEYPFVRFPIDHVFHSEHFRLIDFRRLPYFGSDHFPAFIELCYEVPGEVRDPGKVDSRANEPASPKP
ncbi:MAG TPA: endonuclease/exonuclease/phosphatase family protein [Terriglobales bacterium]|nr:endonuclease/exonuclease/phosphatase family protein [Terriglobales bacterium]